MNSTERNAPESAEAAGESEVEENLSRRIAEWEQQVKEYRR